MARLGSTRDKGRRMGCNLQSHSEKKKGAAIRQASVEQSRGGSGEEMTVGGDDDGSRGDREGSSMGLAIGNGGRRWGGEEEGAKVMRLRGYIEKGVAGRQQRWRLQQEKMAIAKKEKTLMFLQQWQRISDVSVLKMVAHEEDNSRQREAARQCSITNGDVNLAEKEGVGMAGRGCPTWDRHSRMDGAKVVVGQRKRVWRSRTWRSGSGGLTYRTRARKEGEADCRGRNHRCCRLEEEEVKANNYQRKPERGRGVWQWVRVRRIKPKTISLTGEEEADGEEGTSRTSDMGAMTPLVRDCNRGRRCGYVAAVEEAGTSTFGVAEAVVVWGRRWERRKRLLSIYQEERMREKYRCQQEFVVVE
ncbi:hypothetical protein BHM03_00016183 [Ensete ventricosum]|nr:hypothetical protein BHM03_00016183 [Ensete ventricosum]